MASSHEFPWQQRDVGHRCSGFVGAPGAVVGPDTTLVDTVVGELSARLAAVKVGNPALQETNMGPVSTASQKNDVLGGVAKLQSESDVVFGSTNEPALVGAASGKGWFVGPMLLKSRDSKNAKVVHEHEVFGPCATVLPYDGAAAEATSLAGDYVGASGEATIAVGRFFERFPSACLAADPVWKRRITFRGLDRLSVALSS